MGHRGFTLLELMITVVVVAILAAVAVPSYFSYVRDSRRDLAKQSLLAAAQKMESYYALNMSYAGAAASSGSPTVFSDKVPADGTERYYTLTVSASQSSYTLNAVPQGSQTSDSCGTLSLTRTGAKSPSTSGCW
ncbi:type IV pilin protein [Pseudaeromonas paramecii]|uniref:Type IV pilin protein n=1 Tax=Pseudaeromonas paramecii TaxID=2138166 RepID=A0ABP8QBM4_9GAMM